MIHAYVGRTNEVVFCLEITIKIIFQSDLSHLRVYIRCLVEYFKAVLFLYFNCQIRSLISHLLFKILMCSLVNNLIILIISLLTMMFV